MNLVTRCPACGTLFKVVSDQLKISEGWVRCGQCAHIFDAQAQLVSDQIPSDAAAIGAFSTSSSRLENLVSTSEEVSTQSNSSTDFLAATRQSPEAQDSRIFKPGLLRDTEEMDSDAGPSSSSWAQSADPAQQLGSSFGVSVSQSAEPTTINASSASIPNSYATTLGPELATDAPSTTPSFVQDARHAARWRSPWMRAALGLLFLILLAVLALQIALHEKDRLAVSQPALKPWLERLCQHAGCKVGAMKRIDWIAVDASSFNRINKNNPQLEAATQSYRLGVTLKNTGTLPVALPHIELSLQDAQDQVIMRRVLSPADLGSSLTALAPALDMAGSLTLQIDTAQLAGSKIQGYRVLAFYP